MQKNDLAKVGRIRLLSAQLLLFRYILVGSFSALVYVAIVSVMYKLSMSSWLCSFVAYSCCIPIVFNSHKKFVFSGSSENSAWRFTRYMFVQVCSLGAASSIPHFLSYLHFSAELSFFIVAMVIVPFNYSLTRFWVFRTGMGMSK